ncbi:MAG: cupin domain-containing protein [Geobacteraceae bacterium]|nr:cupin domain-containing protein [Geobacteraceae bacterium]
MIKYKIGKKLKGLRLSRRLALREVAEGTGFSQGLISHIENNVVSPPIATLSRILKFFDVKIDMFFTEIEEESRYEIVRKHERKEIPMVISPTGTSQGYSHVSLAIRKQGRKMKPIILALHDTASEYAIYGHDGEKFLFILAGTAVICLDEQHITLEEGDSIYFDSTIKYRLLANHGSEVKILSVEAL